MQPGDPKIKKPPLSPRAGFRSTHILCGPVGVHIRSDNFIVFVGLSAVLVRSIKIKYQSQMLYSISGGANGFHVALKLDRQCKISFQTNRTQKKHCRNRQ
jgi:hypothetical protein